MGKRITLAEIGSPKAKKGGTQYRGIQDFPRTFRKVGPDSNGSFRSVLHDDNNVALAVSHPNEKEFFPGLAREWAVSPERKTVYLRLDPNARWSDGAPVTVDDYFFMYFFFNRNTSRRLGTTIFIQRHTATSQSMMI